MFVSHQKQDYVDEIKLELVPLILFRLIMWGILTSSKNKIENIDHFVEF
jgi:hypothetical protein